MWRRASWEQTVLPPRLHPDILIKDAVRVPLRLLLLKKNWNRSYLHFGNDATVSTSVSWIRNTNRKSQVSLSSSCPLKIFSFTGVSERSLSEYKWQSIGRTGVAIICRTFSSEAVSDVYRLIHEDRKRLKGLGGQGRRGNEIQFRLPAFKLHPRCFYILPMEERLLTFPFGSLMSWNSVAWIRWRKERRMKTDFTVQVVRVVYHCVASCSKRHRSRKLERHRTSTREAKLGIWLDEPFRFYTSREDQSDFWTLSRTS